jgi:hypothetical protein
MGLTRAMSLLRALKREQLLDPHVRVVEESIRTVEAIGSFVPPYLSKLMYVYVVPPLCAEVDVRLELERCTPYLSKLMYV